MPIQGPKENPLGIVTAEQDVGLSAIMASCRLHGNLNRVLEPVSVHSGHQMATIPVETALAPTLRPFPAGRKVPPKETDLFLGLGPRLLSRRQFKMCRSERPEPACKIFNQLSSSAGLIRILDFFHIFE